MRAAAIGLLVGSGLLIASVGIWSEGNPVFAQRPVAHSDQRSVEAGQLIALLGSAGQGAQQVTIIDPELRVMGVYHIDPGSGEISLRSVRNFRWDLMMDEFNGLSPSPNEIRTLLEQR